MKQLEKSMEIHKVYSEAFVICYINYSANVCAVFEFFPCDISTLDVSMCQDSVLYQVASQLQTSSADFQMFVINTLFPFMVIFSFLV
jgi:hypothetical protein